MKTKRGGRWRNWARTVTCRPARIAYPESEAEIVTLVRSCFETRTPLKCVGRGHSYNDIFCPGPTGVLVSLKKFRAIENIDVQKRTVTFQAGLDIPRLIRGLAERGLALSNLGTNIFDTFAGACSTGHHGSGIRYGVLADSVLALDLVQGDGETKTLRRGDPDFAAAAVGLGACGIIIRLTVACEELYALRVAEERYSLADIETNFADLLAGSDHFKFLWVPHTDVFLTWKGDHVQDPAGGAVRKLAVLFRGVILNNLLHEVLLAVARFRRGLVPRINRLLARLLYAGGRGVLPYAWGFFAPHAMKQDAVEFALPIEHTFPAFRALMELIQREKFAVEAPVEVRFAKGDDFYLSPATGRDTCFIGTKIHYPLRLRPPRGREYLVRVAELLAEYGGRPHWGKPLLTAKGIGPQAYPDWEKFREQAKGADPAGIFQNSFLKKIGAVRDNEGP